MTGGHDMATNESLDSDAITFRHVLGEAFISNGPLASVTVALAAAAAFAGGALPLTVLLGALIALTWINTPYQFSAYISSAGGIFAFIRSTLGDRWALSGGIGYYLYGLLLIPANALVMTSMFVYVASVFDVTLPGWIWIPMLALITAVPFLLAYFRITPTLVYGVITAAIEGIVVLAIAIALIIHAGHANSGKVFVSPHLAVNGWKGVIIGMALAYTALGGPEVVVFLGEESTTARDSIRRALRIAQLSVVGLYLLYSYAVTVAWGPTKMGNFALTTAPGLVLLNGIAGRVVMLIVSLLILNSIIGVNVAVNITASRMLFDQARQGLWPAALAKTHRRYHTPVLALVITTFIELAAAVAARQIWGPLEGFVILIVAATAGAVFSFIITDAALIKLGLTRTSSGRLWLVWIPLTSIALLGVAVYGNFFPVEFPTAIGPIALLSCMIGGFLWATVRRRRGDTVPPTPHDPSLVGPAVASAPERELSKGR
jgi:amino acid transporter